ncbi:MAG: PAS domain-containing protein, partial [Anaerolineales bacterium]|nr:PAS domain-containing protein [Anaerolineales bacterium]
MSEPGRVLHIELDADCDPDVIKQLSPRLSTLVHRTITSASGLTQALQENHWDAIVCGNTPLRTNTLHSFFANLPGMACQIRLDADNLLRLPYISEGCFALLGVAPLEIELHPELLLNMLHPEDRDMFHKSMQESITQSTFWNWEGRIVLPPDGEIKWVNLRATRRETDSHGTIWEGFMVNITKNKLAEQEIKTSRQRLRELSSH